MTPALVARHDECDEDVDAHCANVQMGEGRIIKCLKDRSGSISARCNDALKDVGL
jgi:hypothetical protein